MKQYAVTYYIKANSTEYKEMAIVEAKTAAAACAMVKKTVKAQTGRNAFRPYAAPVDNADTITCETAHAERELNTTQKHIEEEKEYEANGWEWATKYRIASEEANAKMVAELTAKGYAVTQNEKGVWKVRTNG